MKLLMTGAIVLLGVVNAASASADAMQDCLLAEIKKADPNTSVGTLRSKCEQETGASMDTVPGEPYAENETLTEKRYNTEYDTEKRDYVITAHQPTYILAYTYNSEFDPADSIYAGTDPKFDGLKKEEVKYQVSMKLPLWRNMFHESNDLYFGYTQTAWWQLYASDFEVSAPFRETNYMPEIFWRHFGGPKIPFGGQVAGFDLSLKHQSNGRSEPISRSWNRIVARSALDFGDLLLAGEVWYRLPEDEDEDDNPDIYRYLGYGELKAIYAPNKNTFTAIVKPGTKYAGAELDWSYKVSDTLRLYAQWYYGYGESMIDYNQKVNRFGIGFAMTDWLVND